jgi:hypothetical protein
LRYSPDIQAFGNLGACGISCDAVSALNATLDFAFADVDGNPFTLTIPSSELNVGPFVEDPSICQTLINAQDGY